MKPLIERIKDKIRKEIKKGIKKGRPIDLCTKEGLDKAVGICEQGIAFNKAIKIIEREEKKENE